MTNAMIFYRTPTTRRIDTGYSDPTNLPANQKLLFTPPKDLANKMNDNYTNNIVRLAPTLPFGRFINQNDEGCAGWLLNVEGNFQQADGDSSSKLHLFRIQPQADTYHIYGCFGILWPNGPSYAQKIDPDNLHGLMIVTASGVNQSITKEIVDFTQQLSYGGDVTKYNT